MRSMIAFVTRSLVPSEILRISSARERQCSVSSYKDFVATTHSPHTILHRISRRGWGLRPLTSSLNVLTLFHMTVETIGQAFSLGWRVTVRCSHSREDGAHSKSSRECTYRKELDMETLVCTRGRAFPLSRLESRLRCPRCGGRNLVVLYQPPASTIAVRHP